MKLFKLNLERKYNQIDLDIFLKEHDLVYSNDIDYCVVIKVNKRIIASAAKNKNVFKFIAIDSDYQAENLLSKLITNLIEQSYVEGHYNYFVYTKIKYHNHFEDLGFCMLVNYKDVGLFEYNCKVSTDYYESIKVEYNINKINGAIIMNCNPITNGHLYLISEASNQVDQLFIFVVEEDLSMFSFKERFELVKNAVYDLPNVVVLRGGPYIITRATFPTYFIKKIDEQIEYYTNIDILLFKKIMFLLNIKYRFVGDEPLDDLTDYYNNTMKEHFGNNLVIFNRLKFENYFISASYVRKLYKNNDLKEIKKIVPQSTYEFLKNIKDDKL